MGSIFLPHGDCSYCAQNNIITIEAEGPWNLEFFIKMHKDLREVIINYADLDDYKILVIFKGEAFAVQEGLDYHLAGVKLGNTKAIALSLEFCNNPGFTKAQFEKVYNEASLANKFFSKTDEALKWLEAY